MLRAKIIRAAIRLFARRGYHGASTKAIAEAAKVSEMTIFRQFGSKEKLAHACLHDVLERMPKPPESGTPLEKVQTWILSLAKAFLDRPSDILFVDVAGLSGIKRLSKVVVQENRLVWAQLEQWMKQAQIDGTLRRDIDLEAVIYSLFGNLIAIKDLCLKFPTAGNCSDLLQRVISQMLAQYRVPNS